MNASDTKKLKLALSKMKSAEKTLESITNENSTSLYKAKGFLYNAIKQTENINTK